MNWPELLQQAVAGVIGSGPVAAVLLLALYKVWLAYQTELTANRRLLDRLLDHDTQNGESSDED